MLAYHYHSMNFKLIGYEISYLQNVTPIDNKNYRYMMFYVFVISQPIELNLDSELEDIYTSHNL